MAENSENNNVDRDRKEKRPSFSRSGSGGRRFTPSRKVCTFCVDGVEYIDYKQVAILQRFLSDAGKIRARRKTGTCAKHQRRLALAVKRARHLALLPYTAGHVRGA
jgi:small subunit ribosomal protein S18